MAGSCSGFVAVVFGVFLHCRLVAAPVWVFSLFVLAVVWGSHKFAIECSTKADFTKHQLTNTV